MKSIEELENELSQRKQYEAHRLSYPEKNHPMEPDARCRWCDSPIYFLTSNYFTCQGYSFCNKDHLNRYYDKKGIK